MVCYELFCSLAGTRYSAFRHRLAIQISKTEHQPRRRDRVSSSGPDSFRSHEDNRASSRGEAFTSAFRCRQEDLPTRVRRTSRRRQGPLL